MPNGEDSLNCVPQPTESSKSPFEVEIEPHVKVTVSGEKIILSDPVRIDNEQEFRAALARLAPDDLAELARIFAAGDGK